MIGPAVHIGAGVQYDHGILFHGQQGSQRRAFDARQQTHDEHAARDRVTGMSGADYGFGLAVLDETAGHLDGSVFLAAKNVRRLFIHVHHIISLDDVEMHVGKVELGEFRFHLGGIPHKEDVQVMKPGGVDGTRNNHGGAKVPSHGINGYDGARVHYSASVLAIT